MKIAENKTDNRFIDTSSDDYGMIENLSEVNNELITVQRQLLKKTTELEKLNKLKDRIIGMAAHDLRNPLSVIMTFTEHMLNEHNEQSSLTEQQQQFISEIYNSSTLMVHIINDLLDITKIESGNIELDLKEIDLVPKVKRIVQLNTILAQKKKIDLHFHSDDASVIKNADLNKLEQILNNLITNGIKFSESHTEIRVHLNRSENDGVILSVADQGQGIPEDELQKLFKPFSKTSVKATAGEQSTGLGLAITQRLVKAHGWQIDVESRVGEGSTFLIRIP
jgi:signal transduction histidine kinase